MKTPTASVQQDGLDRLDQAVQFFEDEWQRHDDVDLERYWYGRNRSISSNSSDSIELLTELVKADLRCRFARGQVPTIAAYLERFPQLKGADTRVLSLIYEEFCLNEEAGRAPDVESFCDRYPDWKSSLASQLRYHRLISKAAGVNPAVPRYPEAGEDFEEFHLVSLLGTGGTSRVFLARDLSLGGKQVVLKVSLDRGQEPKAQGPLDHPHIVPVNSVTFQPDRQLRGLSMPFRMGLPLDEIIKRVNPAARPRKAIVLWNALIAGTHDRVAPALEGVIGTVGTFDAGHQAPTGDGWNGFPVRGSYAQGVAWIVMVVARALHYAHCRHTFHRDVKPANILLTLREGPQLFDFNLADSPHSADQAQAALHGGTVPYMAPEQIAAFLDPALWGGVDARADIYSLGLVLRELVTGEMPELPPDNLSPQRALRNMLDRRLLLHVCARGANPAIPHGLDAIIAKCMTFTADDRYPDAQALAQDLDRFLRHQPLVTATNPSRRERWANWAIRRRAVLTAVASSLVLAGVVLYHPVKEWRKPPIETLPAFLSAVDCLDNDRVQSSLEGLRLLETEYPQSSLLHLYLAFAWNDLSVIDKASKNQDLSESEFQAALADASLPHKVISWAHSHHEIVDYLEDFAATELQQADDLLIEKDHDLIDIDTDKATILQSPHYIFARAALELAVKLKSASPKILRLLAEVEDFFGDFPSAVNRVTRSIELTKPKSNSILENSDLDNLVSCFGLRCRIEMHWAQSLLREGSIESAEVAMTHAANAKIDLARFRRFLPNLNFPTPIKKLRERHLLEMEVDSRLTTCEIEIDRGHLEIARKELDRAKKSFDRWNVNAPIIGWPHAITDRLKKRLSDDSSRLTTPKTSSLVPTDAGPSHRSPKDS